MLTIDCKECVFKKMNQGEQIGCYLDRTEKLPNVKNEDGFFTILKFCSAFRPERWKGDVEVETMEEMISMVRYEMHMPINFVINFKDSIEDLKKTLESISKIKNLNKRSTLTVVNKKVEFNEEISNIIFKQNFHEDRIFLMYMVEDNLPIMNMCFKNFNIGMMATVWAGYEFGDDFEDKIDYFMNDQAKSLYLVYDDNKYLTMTTIFKKLNGDLDLVIPEKEVEKGSLIEKILRRSKGDGIYAWSEFF